MKSIRFSIIAVLLIVSVLMMGFVGCDLDAMVGQGILKLELKSASRSIVWTPALDMGIEAYTISGKGPGSGDSFIVEGFDDGEFIQEGLAVGVWAITVDGYNADGIKAGTVTVAVTIRNGHETTVVATVRPLEGEGTLNLSVAWTDSESKLADPGCSVVIRDEFGEDIEGISNLRELSLGVGGTSATGIINNLPTGWYEVTVGLYEGISGGSPEVVWDGVFVLRIVKDQTTEGSVVISEKQIRFGTGGVAITVEEDMDNPLAVSFTGLPEKVTTADTVTVAATGSFSGNEEYRWYVNGTKVGTGSELRYVFSEVGEYTVSLLVLDGGVLGGFGENVSVTYGIGAVGPAGGLIFYIDEADVFEWTYLESSASDIGIWKNDRYDYDHAFGLYRTNSVEDFRMVEGTSTDIGTGATNTERLVSIMGDNVYISPETSNQQTTTEYAAKLCFSHIEGGYEDWFLPSKDELHQMILNLNSFGLGAFVNYEYYWTSSETAYDLAWGEMINNTSSSQQYSNRVNADRVRAIRSF